MRMIGAPLVYLGPSLPLAAAQAAYPGCIVRPPIARGDLYRDRMLRGSVFLIVDGVFYQDQAISPREILDVLADGALVAGAASMGALRAAECWPAGMRGIGAIYRLFRRGALESDDEVAVRFDERSSSVALIDVRWAIGRAQRAGRLDDDTARRSVTAAERLFYPERTWPAIARAAGMEESALEYARSQADLKARDALRAIARLRRWVEGEPALLDRPRAAQAGLAGSEHERERAADPRAEFARSDAELRLELARFCLASGRHVRQVAALRTRGSDVAAREAERAARLWKVLQESGELDAALFRLLAQRRAAAAAQAAGLAPNALDRHTAEQRIALAHGARSFPELLDRLAGDAELRALVVEHARELAQALAGLRDVPNPAH